MKIVAQITFRQSSNDRVLLITLADNQLTYTIGNNAPSNFFDMQKLKRIYHGESPQVVADNAIAAFRYKPQVMTMDLATPLDKAPVRPSGHAWDVAENAQAHFWHSVANQCPRITSGDFPPDATVAFDRACHEAVAVWLDINQ